MRLRFVEYPSPDARRKLKPEVGETVLYEGTRYVVKEVGLRYVRMSAESNPRTNYVAKIQDIVKLVPASESQGVNPLMNFNP